MDKLNYCSLI